MEEAKKLYEAFKEMMRREGWLSPEEANALRVQISALRTMLDEALRVVARCRDSANQIRAAAEDLLGRLVQSRQMQRVEDEWERDKAIAIGLAKLSSRTWGIEVGDWSRYEAFDDRSFTLSGVTERAHEYTHARVSVMLIRDLKIRRRRSSVVRLTCSAALVARLRKHRKLLVWCIDTVPRPQLR